VRRAITLLCLWLSFAAAAAAYGQDSTSPSPTAQPAAATAVPTSYLLNPGDEIEIYVWGEERLQRSFRILPDGSFSMPLVGKFAAAGKTTDAIEQMVTVALKDQYRDEVPNVTVSVRNPAGLQFSVLGKVKSGGTFTPGRYVNLLEALSLAGGADEFANVDNIAIIRKTQNGVVMIRAKLGSVLKNTAQARDLMNNIPVIQSGDTVIVP
jgi:polysaccharide biosynthesis/export protein